MLGQVMFESQSCTMQPSWVVDELLLARLDPGIRHAMEPKSQAEAGNQGVPWAESSVGMEGPGDTAGVPPPAQRPLYLEMMRQLRNEHVSSSLLFCP